MIEEGIALVLVGSLLAMAIYHFILFALYHKGKEYVFFAVICLCIMIRTLTLDRHSILLSVVIPDVTWDSFKRLEFFCVYLLMGAFPLYIKSLFNEEFPKRLSTFFGIVSVIFCIITLFTSVRFFTSILDISHLIFITEFVVVGFVLFRAFRNGKQEAKITLIGIALVFPFVLVEILSNSNVINLTISFLLEFALLLFLLFQAYILAKRNSKAYYLSEMLKTDLEKVVDQKTAELVEQNELKKNMLSILSHDVKSPLNSIKGTLGMLSSNQIEYKDVIEIAQLLEDQVQNTSMLVDNILQWCSSQGNAIKIDKKKLLIHPFVDECFRLFTYQAHQKNIQLKNAVDSEILVDADENVIRLVLRNLISNAMKFSHRGGSIIVSSKQEDSYTQITISDTGIGMDEETLESLFNMGGSRQGTNLEMGTGLGLSLCKKYIEAMGATISVKSDVGIGTKFNIALQKTNTQVESEQTLGPKFKVA